MTLSLSGCFGMFDGAPETTSSALWRDQAGMQPTMQMPIDKDRSVAFTPPTFENAGDFGTLTSDSGGDEDTLWVGVDPQLANTLPIAPPVKAASANFKKMMLSDAHAPAGLGAEWLGRRVQSLLLMGDKQDATNLAYQSLRGRVMGTDEHIDTIQLLLWTGHKDAACLEALSDTSGHPVIGMMQSFCLKSDAPNMVDDQRYNTIMAFGSNQMTGQNAALPEPSFVQILRQNADHAVFTEERNWVEEFAVASDAKQKGRVILLTYQMMARARIDDERIEPENEEAALQAWRAIGWTSEAAQLQSEFGHFNRKGDAPE